MSGDNPVLFTAGHGFYHFLISNRRFERSLYYNLLLQPTLAIPDHYLLQGEWMGRHIQQYPARDSWLEIGLRNGFITPYFRLEGKTLPEILDEMIKGDRRGFSKNAHHMAERIARTPFTPRYWSSGNNSQLFGDSLRHYLLAADPPMMETAAGLDPDDFAGFWRRSRDWIEKELDLGYERSAHSLRKPGVLLSQMIQVSGERVLGRDCGTVSSIGELLAKAQFLDSPDAYRDLRAYYTIMCELYSRSLSDTLLTVPNSPRWRYYVAALDMSREQLAVAPPSNGGIGPAGDDEDVDTIIKLPRVAQLRRVSGDVLLKIRRSPACERFFESLADWKGHPDSPKARIELLQTLSRYSQLIVSEIGGTVGSLGLRPRFVSSAWDIVGLVARVPDLVHGLLALAGVGAVSLGAPPVAQVTLFGLLAVLAPAKHISPYKRVGTSISVNDGIRLDGDISISRG